MRSRPDAGEHWSVEFLQRPEIDYFVFIFFSKEIHKLSSLRLDSIHFLSALTLVMLFYSEYPKIYSNLEYSRNVNPTKLIPLYFRLNFHLHRLTFTQIKLFKARKRYLLDIRDNMQIRSPSSVKKRLLIFSDFTPKVSISCRVPLLTISSKRRTALFIFVYLYPNRRLPQEHSRVFIRLILKYGSS